MPENHESLKNLARKHGIALRRPSPDGHSVPVSNATLSDMLTALRIEFDAPDVVEAEAVCYLPSDLQQRPCWGVSLQLYELRSHRNWGIGDFSDLEACCDMLAPLGADFIGLNPLHAPFIADPDRCSPYEPSNRQFLNPLYIAVDAVDGFAANAELAARLEHLRALDLVDYVAVAEAKLAVLRALWAEGKGGCNSAEFAAFAEEGGQQLHRHALFEAISGTMAAEGKSAGWKGWPSSYQTPFHNDVERFAEKHADLVLFHKWLQWLAHSQLSNASKRARDAGMRVGLYLDLAVGEALDGSATWSDPDIYVAGASIGNPPEPFAIEGQDWRLAALLPQAIASGSPSPFHRLLAAAMRYAGAIRIDHAAALSRLFLVPTKGGPADGTYVSYPQEDLLRVLADTSQHYGSIVIGEDLGNIPDGLRDDLALANILSYRILSYERTNQGFVEPEAYPALALACVSTHDHQTFTGWWRGDDIAMRTEHGLVPEEMTRAHEIERDAERADLVRAFTDAEILGEAQEPFSEKEKALRLAVNAYQYIGRSPSMLVAVRLADLSNEPKPTNIPGTSSSYPNWKPKLSVSLEELGTVPLFEEVVSAMARCRPR